MADWLVHVIVQVGGIGAVLVPVVILTGKWLWRKIDKALDTYTDKYPEQKATIDARIANLEKLVEEQARITRTVENIKAEIASEARSRDNRWDFRKDVYVSLLTATTDLRGILTRLATFSALHRAEPEEQIASKLQPLVEEQRAAIKQFGNATVQAPLAMADDVLALVNEAMGKLPRLIDLRSQQGAAFMDDLAATMGRLETRLQVAGRKDLWGTPEPEAKVEPATQP